jgi:cytochrome c oxidase cbb3-type subunit 2
MVAYLQKLGTGIPRKTASTQIQGELLNPFAGQPAAIQEGAVLYQQHCAACHGEDLAGDIGPELTDTYLTEAELYQVFFDGVPSGGMPAFSTLGADRIWKLVNFIKSKGSE